MLEKLAADGKITASELQAAWSKALDGKDLADFEAKARAAFFAARSEAEKAAKAYQDAFSQGVAAEQLKALKATSDATFAVLTREAERSAQLVDALLREAVKRTGLEFEQLQGRIGTTSRSAINDVEAIIAGLDKLKAEGVDTGRALTASLSKAIQSADSEKALETVRSQIEQVRKVLGDKIADGLLDQAKEKALALKDALDQATPGINSVREALKQLGVTSDETLKKTATDAKEAYDTLTASGTASVRELGEGFKRAAEAAIAANKGVAPAWVEGQAAVRGYEVQLDAAGKATLKLRDSIEQTGASSGRVAPGMQRDWGGVTSAIRTSTQALQEYQRRMQQTYGRPGEGDKGLFERGRFSSNGQELGGGVQEVGTGGSQFRNKDGWSSDAMGRALTQGIWTRTAIIDYLKQAGLDELLARKLSEQFVDANGKVPYTAKDVQKRWAGKFGTLSEALGNMAEHYKYTDEGNAEADQMLDFERRRRTTPQRGPATSAGGSGGSSGATYVSNITIDGQPTTVRFADAESQGKGEDLLRRLARAKSTAVR